MKTFLSFLKKDHTRGILAIDHKRFTLLLVIIVIGIMLLLKPYVLNLYTFKVRLVVMGCYIFMFTLGCTLIRILVHKPHRDTKYTNLDEALLVINSIIASWFLSYIFSITYLDTLIKSIFGKEYQAMIPEGFLWGSFITIFSFGLIVYAIMRLYDFAFILFGEEDDPNHKKVLKISSSKISRNQKMIVLIGKNKGERVEVQQKKFIYIKGEGHYLNLHYLSPSNQLESTVLRLTMKEAESQLESVEHLIRCHRSYILNTEYLKTTVTETKKNYAILISNFGEIPISSDKIDLIRDISA